MARDRSIKLVIQAQVDGAKRALNETADAARKVGQESEKASKTSATASERMAKSARENAAEWQKVGTALTTFGTVTTGALAGTAKAAIDWESAWAGVLKTVDATPSQLAALEQGLRDLTGVMPASHAEIAAVAEAAGQLGIETPNILGFTETMIQMGTATNLSSEQAATALARFVNIMGTSQAEFSNIGAAVVGLGNNFATTEAEIVEMGLRLAGAGRQAGLTEGEVLGLATALSSVGIEAQAGGTAFSRVLIEMGAAVDTQSAKLETFAQVAGMSAAQFSQAWEEDAGSAIAAFVEGLGAMEASGQSIQPILEDLGMTDIRVGDALRRASGAADLFTGAMAMGNEEFAKNTALTDEAAKRYETVASQLAIMKNKIVDAAIGFGDVFLPAISGVVGAVGDAADALSGLPGPIKGIVGVLGGVAGVASLAAGGFMLLAPRALETWDAFQKLSGISPATATNLTNVGKAAGGAATALGVLAIVGPQLQNLWMDQAAGANEAGEALLDYAANGAAAEIASRDLIWGFENLGSIIDTGLNRNTLKNVGEGFAELGTAFGVFGGTALDHAQQWFKDVDAGLANMVASGNAEAAADLFEQIATQAEAQGVSLATVRDALPQASAALDANAQSTEAAAEATTLLEDALGGASDGAEELATNMLLLPAEQVEEDARLAAEALTALQESISGASASFVDSQGAYEAATQKAQEWAQGQADATETAEDSWEDFVADFTGTKDEYLAALEEMVESQSQWESNLLDLIARGVPEQFVQELAALGPAAAEEVALIASMSDAELEKWVTLMGEKSGEGINAFGDALSDPNVLAVLQAAGEQLGGKALDGLIEELASGELTVQQAIDQYELEVELPIDQENAVTEATKWLETVKATTQRTEPVEIPMGADATEATEVRDSWVVETENTTATATQDADRSPADQAVYDWIDEVTGTTATATQDADATPAYDETSGWERVANFVTATADLDADSSRAHAAVGAWAWESNNESATASLYANASSAYSTLYGFLAAARAGATIRLVASRVGGFMAGGYTGDIPRTAEAGVVHGQEFVTHAAATADPYNRAVLEFMHAGGSMKEAALPRYATAGGSVPTFAPAVPSVNVAAPSLEGMRIEGQMELRDGDAWFVGQLHRHNREIGRASRTAAGSGVYTR